MFRPDQIPTEVEQALDFGIGKLTAQRLHITTIEYANLVKLI